MNAKILIVDDSPEDCDMYQRHLRRGDEHNFTFAVAHSAKQGLERCRGELPDCILLDFNLPDADGLEFLVQLQQEHEEKRPPVVMVTGQGNESVAVQAMKSGAQDYLVKGITPDGLRHSIQNAIQHVALRRLLDEQQAELKQLSEAKSRLVEELEQKAAELADADRRKNDFLAVLAHELRNPLGPIRNAAQIIRMQLQGALPDVEQAQGIIDRQIGHMSHLIDDLLDVSRIVRGKVRIEKEPLDLCELIRATVQDHQGEFDEGEFKLSVNIPAAEICVEGDATRLSQVLDNILHNARKFTPRGGAIGITLSIKQEDNSALIRVIDSGEGLDAGMTSHMFEIFSQADRSLNRSRGGLGLGLAIVKGITELHGGSVQAFSAGPGRGCEISVRLPLCAARSSIKTPAPVPHRSESLKVLIVEDNRDAAVTLQRLLEMMGHVVQTAHSGSAALELASSFQPAVVICDIGLSEEMSGYDVAAKLRETRTSSQAFLVALTGYGRAEDERRSQDAGFDLHMVKPVTVDALQAMLAKAVYRTVNSSRA